MRRPRPRHRAARALRLRGLPARDVRPRPRLRRQPVRQLPVPRPDARSRDALPQRCVRLLRPLPARQQDAQPPRLRAAPTRRRRAVPGRGARLQRTRLRDARIPLPLPPWHVRLRDVRLRRVRLRHVRLRRVRLRRVRLRRVRLRRVRLRRVRLRRVRLRRV
ncbi:pentapeptide repeat-containing protein, partial [Lysobacter tyrosinilyticus]